MSHIGVIKKLTAEAVVEAVVMVVVAVVVAVAVVLGNESSRYLVFMACPE